MDHTIVSLRVRDTPSSKQDPNIWTLVSNQQIQLNEETHQQFLESKRLTSRTKTSFKFDYCFTQQTNNSYIYDTVVKPLVISALKGINSCLFLYGQTGSGKTYTMLGNTNQEFKESAKNINFSKDAENVVKTPKGRNELKRTKTLANPELFFQLSPQNFLGPGVLNFSMKDLFNFIEEDQERTYLLKVSYLEIYNENVYDLLQPKEKLSDILQINEEPIKGFFFIKGIVEETVNSIEDVLSLLQKGEENRHYAQTVMNHTSSRSHTVFRIIIKSFYHRNLKASYRKKPNLITKSEKNINNLDLLQVLITKKLNKNLEEREIEINDFFEENYFEFDKGTIIKESHLNFIDLGGSEKVSNLYTDEEIDYSTTKTPDRSRDKSKSPIRQADKSTSNVKERVKEGQYINKSLFFLTQVLSFRTEGNKDAPHIPYRNSSLTKILKSSLGGNSKIVIICCITPNLSQFDHTMSTLRFGTNTKRCVLNKKPEDFHENHEEELANLKEIIAEYERKAQEFAKKEEEMQALRRENRQLRERLSRNNAKNALIYLKSLPKTYKRQFLDQMREDIAYIPGNGLVFMTENNRKYSLINPEKKSQSLKYNWQELIFDYEGVFALRNYKLIKEINRILLEKLQMFKEKTELWFIEFSKKTTNETEKITIKYQNMMKLMNIRFNKVAEEFGKLASEYWKAKKRLDIFEKYENLNGLNDNELERLEKHLLKGFDIVKDERFRRKYEKNCSQMSTESKDRAKRKNFDVVFKIIENFLDFQEINEELDFDIEEDFLTYEEKQNLASFKGFIKEKFDKIYEEIIGDPILQKKIENLQEYDLKFHQNYELKDPEKKYENMGLFEETFSDEFLENFVEDKEFLGEKFCDFSANSKKDEVFRIVSPLTRPRSSLQNVKERKNSSADENLFDSATSLKDLHNKEIFSVEKDDVSFDNRSKNAYHELYTNRTNDFSYQNQTHKEKESDENRSKSKKMQNTGKMGNSVSEKAITNSNNSDKEKTVKKLQKPEFKNFSNLVENPNSKQKISTKSKKSSVTRVNEDFFEGGSAKNNEDHNNPEKKQKLLSIDETKIKTEGDDTFFSASIFEDRSESEDGNRNRSSDMEGEAEGWLFDDDKNEKKRPINNPLKKNEKKTKLFKK